MDQTSSSNSAQGVTSRRDFLRRSGAGIGIAASVLSIQACDANDPEIPNDGTLQGYVREPDGAGVEGATVTLNTGETRTTDENGFYQFAVLASGTYTLTVVPPAGLLTIGEFDQQSADVNVVRGGTGYVQNFNFGSTLPVVTFDFSSDVGVLNYAYALEQLEAAFYAIVLANPAFGTIFNADEQQILRDLAAHEAIHRDFLKAALGSAAIPDLLPDFEDIDFSKRTTVAGSGKLGVLNVARTFEDLGVAAYNGAGRYLQSAANLTLAGKIVSVEARHASVISGLITPNAIAGPGIINAAGLDRALSPSDVLTAADPFIFNTVSASNVPSS